MRSLLIASLLVALTACASRREAFAGEDPSLPFSRAVRVDDTVYVAGHLGLDPETRRAPVDPAVEVNLMLDAFGKTLDRAGVGWDDLVQVQVFCADVGLYDTFNAAYRERFSGAAFPARAFLGSGALLRGARFELNGIAVNR